MEIVKSVLLMCLVIGDIYGGKHIEDLAEQEIIDFVHSTCAVTRDDKQFPWWQVVLDGVSAVRKVEIEIGNQSKLYRLHDLVVRVSNIDISHDLSADKVYERGRVCGHFPGVLNSTRIEVWCKNYVAGNFVIIQLTKKCVFPSCLRYKGNYLKLCKVTVWGNSITLRELHEGEHQYEEREKQEFNQSSVAFNGFPDLAKTETSVVIQNTSLCAALSDNLQGTFSGPYYIIEFGHYFLVTKIRFLVKLQQKSLIVHLKVYTYKEIIKEAKGAKVRLTHSYCGEWSGEVFKGDTVEISCDQPTLGHSGIIDIVNDKLHVTFLSGCFIEFWGHQVTNVAKYKPTKQSSQRLHSFPSYVVVDGIKSRKTHYKSEHFPAPHCMRTDADDINPWWRVDLIKYYMVKGVYLATGGSDRLHDIEIRVGDRDVSETANNSLFTDNYVCQDFTGHVLYEFTLYVECAYRLLGRFVSIQVTRTCNNTLCKKKKEQALSLCEVQVFGLPVDPYYYGNVATGRILLRSQHLLSYYKLKGDEEGIGNYGWLFLYMKQTSIVKNVVMYPSHLNISDMKINAQIRVGYEEMTPKAHREWQVKNDLCYEGHFNISDEDKLFEVWCDRPVFGSKILIQYECEWNVTGTSCNKLRLFSTIEVWIYKIKSSEKLRQPYNSDESLIYGWKKNEIDVMATENKQIYEVDEPPLTCTHTIPGEDPFPWFRIKFPDIYRITGVELNNTQDETHRRLHNIQIRVGYDDIAEAPTDKPFSANKLCFASGNTPLDRGLNIIHCSTPLLGTFLTIQIVKPCIDPHECDVLEPNILHLCHVKLTGTSAGPKDVNENLSLGRLSIQSSTFERKHAMLANN